MWVELICGLVLYRFVRRFFHDDGEDLERLGSDAIFSVADRLQSLYGGKAYVGLRIPDPDTASRQNIDLILVTKQEAVVVAVVNFPGLVSIDGNGSWASTGISKHKTVHHLDPVVDAKRKVVILESYLEQRGVALPEGYLSCKVVCPNPNFRTIYPDYFPSEVVTYERWTKLRPEPKGLSGWIKGALRSAKKEMQEPIQQNLFYILDTAPMWDRLELKSNKRVLGEFVEFEGKHDDRQALRNIRRSKVSRMVIQKASMFDLGQSMLQVLYCPRDYRALGSGSGSGSEWKEVSVRSSTQVLFQPQDCAKVGKIKLSSINSLSLSV